MYQEPAQVVAVLGDYAFGAAAMEIETCARLGITPHDDVVLYTNGRSMWGARAYWVLRYFRFPHVRVADCSVAALAQAGVAVTTQETTVTPVT